MWILFAALSAVLLLLLIRQRILYRKLQKEIEYISNRLATLSIASENGFVLLPAAHICVRKLGAAVNTLLWDFYAKKSEFGLEQKAMAQVLTNISHDIRTPLTVLKGNSEMLAARTADLPGAGNIHEMAVKIDRKADVLITTISDYFTMSRITSGDLPLKLQKEDISQLCHDTILDYYDLLDQKQFTVEIQVPPVPICADTDRDLLQRILKNLIDNAIRHGGDGKYIALRLTTTKDKSVIEIEDHGKGMTPQQQKRIFARDYTTAPGSTGSGLGLAIAKSLCEMTGAELEVHSIQNQKTIFSIIMKSCKS